MKWHVTYSTVFYCTVSRCGYIFITFQKIIFRKTFQLRVFLLSSPSYTSVSQISPSVDSSDYKTCRNFLHKSSLFSAHLFYSIGILLSVCFFLRNPCSDRVFSLCHFSTLFLSNSLGRWIRRSTQARLSFPNSFGVHFTSWFYFYLPQGTKYLPLKLPNLVLVRSKLQAKVTYLSRQAVTTKEITGKASLCTFSKCLFTLLVQVRLIERIFLYFLHQNRRLVGSQSYYVF